MCTIETLRRMMGVGTPLIAIESHDHPHTLNRIRAVLKEQPAVGWNCSVGFYPINSLGETALSDLEPAQVKMASQGTHAACHIALQFPPTTVLIVENLHWSWDKPATMQALINAREPFKSTNRTIIGLTLNSPIPADLVQSLSFILDPLPTEDALAEICNSIHQSAVGSDLEDSGKSVARELRGCSPFRAEQLAAQSLTKRGYDANKLRDNARKQINDTVGLSVESGSETFDDIGGLDAIRSYLAKYFSGPRRPSVVVRIEEIEKALAGVGKETSGTSGDALGAILTAMEDNRWTGILAYGVSGCGKSLVAKACANEFGAKAIRFDINACKGSLVGESEKQIRSAMDIIHAIGGERVFFIASMNQIASLPPELRRRFAAGTWYFDVPDKAARKDIWTISCESFGVEHDGYDAEMLTGADIRDIAQRAYELGCSTTEAAGYHVPLCKAAPDAISQSRSDATNRYLDANNGGPYRDPTKVETQYSRSMELPE